MSDVKGRENSRKSRELTSRDRRCNCCANPARTPASTSLALCCTIFRVSLHLRLSQVKKALSTLDVTHVIKSPRLSPRIFNGLASSKVIRWNYCTLRKGREPGNEATIHMYIHLYIHVYRQRTQAVLSIPLVHAGDPL